MARVIPIEHKVQKVPDNLIASRPMEFRRAHWEATHFVQFLRSQSEKLESQRANRSLHAGERIGSLPPHFTLRGGMAFTIRALYAGRHDEGRMREIYHLIGLMDCMINQVNPILRTDLLRDMYKKVFQMKKTLSLQCHAHLDQVLLPIDSQFFNEFEYRASLQSAQTLKDLYAAIREGTDEMFDILGLEYVFYCPGAGV
jgi:hypothetical protein